MQCPKDRGTALISDRLPEQLQVKCCPTCEGQWIPSEEYVRWREGQPEAGDSAALIERILDTEYTPSPLDTKAALCPECSCYLARAKVSARSPFYVERCPNCKGIWCDRGEWEVLVKTGLHRIIEQLFSNDWQNLVREREQFAQERRATIDKLGSELAAQVFELANALEQHPNGDFGVAYLMRRLEK